MMKYKILFFLACIISSAIQAQEWAPAGKVAKAKYSLEISKHLPFMNPDLSIEERVFDLIDRMTLEEKIGWLDNYNPAIERLGISDFEWLADACHGLGLKRATMFPHAIGLAATFDTDLLYRAASAISDEARGKYNNGEGAYLSFWSPNINIVRDPRWGRNQETYGEDPYLTSRMGVAYVKGMHGDNDKYLKVITCPKHFMVHNGPEKGKRQENRIVSEIDLLETYQPAFEAVVKEGGAKGIMGAYNLLNWESCVASKYLTQGLLRDKWGFDGYFVTDCNSLSAAPKQQKRVATPEEAVALALKSGVDLNCGSMYLNHTKTALEKGLISMADIDLALFRTIRVKMELGLFDAHNANPYSKISPEVIQCDAHKALAMEAALKSMTLLQNDGTLPLSNNIKSIALIGPGAVNKHMLTGNYTGVPDKIHTIYEGVTKKAKQLGVKVNYAMGTAQGDEEFMELVPEEMFTTPDGKRGLKAEFFYKPDFEEKVKEMIVEQVDFAYEWNSIIDEQDWIESSIRFSGYLKPKVSGKYLLSMEGAQGYSVIIDGDTIIFKDRNREGHFVSYSAIKREYELKANRKYKIEISINKSKGKNNMHFYWKEPGINPFEQALEAAKKSDIIVYAGGSSYEFEDENKDRKFITLPEKQKHLLSELIKTGKPVVMVLINGSMTALDKDDLKCKAILDTWFTGQAGGLAVADVLFGDYNPAGRTAVTFYKSENDIPAFNEFSMENRTYKYFSGEPNFRFGHGLSYTDFEYSNLNVVDKADIGDEIKVSVDIKNTGKYDGDEVVQLYVHVKGADMPVPISSLKAFKRINIKKGASKTVEFKLNPKDLAYVNRLYEWEVKPGEVEIFVGNCSPKVVNGKAVASKKVLMKKIKLAGTKLCVD